MVDPVGIELTTETTPPAASCPARTLHATEIACKRNCIKQMLASLSHGLCDFITITVSRQDPQFIKKYFTMTHVMRNVCCEANHICLTPEPHEYTLMHKLATSRTFFAFHNNEMTRLILGLYQANGRRRHKVTPSHINCQGAHLDSVLKWVWCLWCTPFNEE